MLSEFGLKFEEVLFDFTIAQLDSLVLARIKRNEAMEKEGKKAAQRRQAKTEPEATPGTMADLKKIFGNPR